MQFALHRRVYKLQDAARRRVYFGWRIHCPVPVLDAPPGQSMVYNDASEPSPYE